MSQTQDKFTFEFDAPTFSEFLPNKDMSFYDPRNYLMSQNSELDAWFNVYHELHYKPQSSIKTRKKSVSEIEIMNNNTQWRSKGESRPIMRKRKQISKDSVRQDQGYSLSDCMPVKRATKKATKYSLQGVQNQLKNNKDYLEQNENLVEQNMETAVQEKGKSGFLMKQMSQDGRNSTPEEEDTRNRISKYRRRTLNQPNKGDDTQIMTASLKDKESGNLLRGKKEQKRFSNGRKNDIREDVKKDQVLLKKNLKSSCFPLLTVVQEQISSNSPPIRNRQRASSASQDARGIWKRQSESGSTGIQFKAIQEQVEKKKRNKSLDFSELQRTNNRRQSEGCSLVRRDIKKQVIDESNNKLQKVLEFEKNWEKNNGIKLYMLDYQRRKEIRQLCLEDNS